MNKLLIGLILALCVPLTALAEQDMDSGFAEKHTENLTKALSLNDEQKTKVEAILKGQQEKFKALREETHASIKAVLTPEQVTKFDAMQEKRQEMRKQRMTNKTK
jgi:periplasmic protein CpxP/Spy